MIIFFTFPIFTRNLFFCGGGKKHVHLQTFEFKAQSGVELKILKSTGHYKFLFELLVDRADIFYCLHLLYC